MMLYSATEASSTYRADLSMVWTGAEWKYRLVHKWYGGRWPSKVQYSDYVSQENALKAFVRLYGADSVQIVN